MKKLIVIIVALVIGLASYAQVTGLMKILSVEDYTDKTVDTRAIDDHRVVFDDDNFTISIGNEMGSRYTLSFLKDSLDVGYVHTYTYKAIDEETIPCTVIVMVDEDPSNRPYKVAVVAMYRDCTITWYGELDEDSLNRKTKEDRLKRKYNL